MVMGKLKERYFEHKGFYGSAEVNLREDCLEGRILFIQDIVTYEAKSISKLRKSFENAVDDYFETCKTLGQEPEQPFEGNMNLRLGEDLHREAATYAQINNQNLNKMIVEALESRISDQDVSRRYHLEVIAMILIIGLLIVLVNLGFLQSFN
jgi:predicted HicB family RNase H-like nuclease